MIIKVCGMRDADNIRAVDSLPVDWLGLIFAPRSPRYVSEPPAYLPARARRVGVFVDTPLADILQHVRDYALHLVQLHGHESPDYLKALRSLCGDSIAAPAIIKAFNIATAADLAATADYAGHADYYLFDTRATPPAASPAATPPAASPAAPLPGGTGAKFDWSVLADYVGETPFLLSGGIGPDDAERVRAFHHPQCIGIDLNSRFETAPALKDTNQLEEFIKKIRL